MSASGRSGRFVGHTELLQEQQEALRRARRVQWMWLGILVLTVVAMAAVMGSSQAMKTAWMEDMLSFLPPLAFLIGARVAARAPDERFPFGYHRAVGVGHLVSGVADDSGGPGQLRGPGHPGQDQASAG